MKKIMLSVIAVMCLAGFSSLSFAEDMGKMKGDMKGMKDMKGDMSGVMMKDGKMMMMKDGKMMESDKGMMGEMGK